MKDMAKIEQELHAAHVVIPEAPELVQVLASAAGPVGDRHVVHGLVLLLRVAAMLLVVGAAYAAIQIVGTRSGKTLAKLTPLRVVNEAWSAADGYVLEFDVYDAGLPAGGVLGPASVPHYDRFREVAYNWADQHGLSHPADDVPFIREEWGLAILKTGGGSSEGQYVTSHAQVNVRSDDENLIKELVKILAGLPGVVEPEVSRMTMYFGLGGLTPEMDRAKVLINGTSYDFPEDFGPGEAQSLYWEFRGLQDGSVLYLASPRWLLIRGQGQTEAEAKSSRFDLGDVVRMAKDGAGNLIISTIVRHWDGLEGVDREDGHSGSGGWVISIPPEVEESSVDPLAELQRAIHPLREDVRLRRYFASVEVWFVPLEQIKTQGGLSITQEQKQQAAELVSVLSEAVRRWKQEHPSVIRSLAAGDRVHGGPQKAGVNTVAFVVGLSTDDLAELDSLKQKLAAVKGVPEVSAHVRDMQPFIEMNQKHSPAPLK